MPESVTNFRSIPQFYPPPESELLTPWEIEVFSASHEPERWHIHQESARQSLIKRRLEGVDRNHERIRQDCPTYVAEARLVNKLIGGAKLSFPNPSCQLPALDWLVGYVDTKRLHDFIKKSGRGRGCPTQRIVD